MRVSAGQAERLLAHLQSERCDRIEVHAIDDKTDTVLVTGWVGGQLNLLEVMEAEPTYRLVWDMGLPR